MMELYIRLILNGQKTLLDIENEEVREKVRAELISRGMMFEVNDQNE